MKNRNSIISISIILFFSLIQHAEAQFQLPTFDVELKVNQNLLPNFGSQTGEIEFVETTNIHGGIHLQINQHIAVGGFYSRSFRGSTRIDLESSKLSHESELLLKGINIRFSTGRAKNWRKYLQINYSQVEIVQDNGALRLAGKTNAIGGNIGFMRRLNNNLYLNILELGVKVISDEIFWVGESEKIIGDVKMGLTYNIGKKK